MAHTDNPLCWCGIHHLPDSNIRRQHATHRVLTNRSANGTHLAPGRPRRDFNPNPFIEDRFFSGNPDDIKEGLYDLNAWWGGSGFDWVDQDQADEAIQDMAHGLRYCNRAFYVRGLYGEEMEWNRTSANDTDEDHAPLWRASDDSTARDEEELVKIIGGTGFLTDLQVDLSSPIFKDRDVLRNDQDFRDAVMDYTRERNRNDSNLIGSEMGEPYRVLANAMDRRGPTTVMFSHLDEGSTIATFERYTRYDDASPLWHNDRQPNSPVPTESVLNDITLHPNLVDVHLVPATDDNH